MRVSVNFEFPGVFVDSDKADLTLQALMLDLKHLVEGYRKEHPLSESYLVDAEDDIESD